MVYHHQARHTADKQSSQSTYAALGEPADQSWQTKANHDPDRSPPLVLPTDERVGLKIVYVYQRHLASDRAKKHPPDVGMEKPEIDVVRIVLLVGVLVVSTVV